MTRAYMTFSMPSKNLVAQLYWPQHHRRASRYLGAFEEREREQAWCQVLKALLVETEANANQQPGYLGQGKNIQSISVLPVTIINILSKLQCASAAANNPLLSSSSAIWYMCIIHRGRGTYLSAPARRRCACTDGRAR